MNDVNTEFFFGEDENVVITLTEEDGTETDVTPIAHFEIEEMGTEYLIVVELDGEELTEEMQLLRYTEDEDGEPDITTIEDEEEYELAAEACKQILKSGAIEGFDVEDEEEEETDDYLQDLGKYIPGAYIDDEQ